MGCDDFLFRDHDGVPIDRGGVWDIFDLWIIIYFGVWYLWEIILRGVKWCWGTFRYRNYFCDFSIFCEGDLFCGMMMWRRMICILIIWCLGCDCLMMWCELHFFLLIAWIVLFGDVIWVAFFLFGAWVLLYFGMGRCLANLIDICFVFFLKCGGWCVLHVWGWWGGEMFFTICDMVCIPRFVCGVVTIFVFANDYCEELIIVIIIITIVIPPQ